MASYHTTASKLNPIFKDAFEGLDEEQVKKVVNAIIWFGQTAKYRCRNNSAYDTYCGEVFRGIQHLERKDFGLGFAVLRCVEKESNVNIDDYLKD